MSKTTRGIGTLICGLSMVFLLFGAGSSALDKPADNQVYFYMDTGYSGARMDIKYVREVVDLSELELAGSEKGWDNVISSVQIGKYVKILAYEQPNFEGKRITLEANGHRARRIADLGKLKWDDRISSFKIAKNEKAP